MTSAHDSHTVGANMLFRFRTDLEAEKKGKKGSDENSSAFEGRKQQAAIDAIVNAAVIPSGLVSVPPSPPGGIFLGTGGQFPDDLPCPTEVDLKVEPELDSPAVQDTSADIFPDLEQDLRGFGARLATDTDPRDYSTDLGDDLEKLG